MIIKTLWVPRKNGYVFFYQRRFVYKVNAPSRSCHLSLRTSFLTRVNCSIFDSPRLWGYFSLTLRFYIGMWLHDVSVHNLPWAPVRRASQNCTTYKDHLRPQSWRSFRFSIQRINKLTKLCGRYAPAILPATVCGTLVTVSVRSRQVIRSWTTGMTSLTETWEPVLRYLAATFRKLVNKDLNPINPDPLATIKRRQQPPMTPKRLYGMKIF